MENKQQNTTTQAPFNASVPRIMDENLTRDILFRCIRNWYWFVLSIVVCVGIASFKYYRTIPEYTRTMSLLINDYAKGTSSVTGEEQFQRMGMFFTRTTLANEILILTSIDVAKEVVDRLDLQTTYYGVGRIHNVFLYGHKLPVKVKFLDMSEYDAASFFLTVKNGNVEISDIKYKGDKELEGMVCTGMLMDPIETPMGRVVVLPTEAMGQSGSAQVLVNRTTYNNAVAYLSGRLSVNRKGSKDEKSNILEVSYVDKDPKKAEDVLNDIIEVYNDNWVADRNKSVVKTSQFVNERLHVIEQELGEVDGKITQYKAENLIADASDAGLYMNQAKEAETKIQELNNQVYMAKYLRNMLTANIDQNQLLPSNSGLGGSNIANQITAYNEMILKRVDIVAASSEKNPILKEYDASLKSYREAMVLAIDNELVSLNKQIETLQKISEDATNQIASTPQQKQYLLSIARQQKVKESLYLFLLQKREENELSQAFSAYNTRVISSPSGSNHQSYPVAKTFLMYALLIGFAIPAVLIFISEVTNTTVRGKKDIEHLPIPYIGEIPEVRNKHRNRFVKAFQIFFNIHKNYKLANPIVVKHGSRNSINEAFRIARTNLDFMCTAGGHKVIMVTSANPCSGKTFISGNLSTAFALKGKKVCAVDLDIRRRSLSAYINHPDKGIVDYLAGLTDDLASLTVKTEFGVDMIPVGVIPPNPTELLSNDRLSKAIETLKSQYDYVFLDCPPVEIVADTSLISGYADITIFVIRAGILERSILPQIEKMYVDGRFNNMTMLLNGTESARGYGYYRYGYSYGYHYGYGEYYGSK